MKVPKFLKTEIFSFLMSKAKVFDVISTMLQVHLLTYFSDI